MLVIYFFFNHLISCKLDTEQSASVVKIISLLDSFTPFKIACFFPITPFSKDDIFKFAAIASTLNDLMIKSNAPNKVNLLSLDVEGAEIEVLNGINFNQYIFEYILIESRSFDLINSFLKNKNYKFLEKLSQHDYLFSYNKL